MQDSPFIGRIRKVLSQKEEKIWTSKPSLVEMISWGTALSQVLRNDSSTSTYLGKSSDQIDEINTQHTNKPQDAVLDRKNCCLS